jgi:aminoglycoside phosphotransferase (APT) family kinase protein
MHVEVGVLEAAYAAGVPVPRVLASSRDISGENPVGTQFMIVNAFEGETIARKILRDDEYASARKTLPAQFGSALGKLHRVNSAVEGLEDVDQIAFYQEHLRDCGQSHPAFEIAFRWLEENRPPVGRRCLVHGDFRMGNLIIGNEGLRAVLDWELAHIGDPAEDLGWLCVRAWRFGGAGVGGIGAYEGLLEAYGEASGEYISLETLRWWEVLGTVKWGLMCISQAAYHLTGSVRSHELAAIGRRVCENEYDALLAIRELKKGKGSTRV